MNWSWNISRGAGSPEPLFQLSNTTTDFLWPVAALPVGSSGTASSILLLSDRVRASSGGLGFANVATTVINIQIRKGANPPGPPTSNGLPDGWTYSTCDLPWTGKNGLMWSTALFPQDTSLINGKVVPPTVQGKSQPLYMIGDYSPPGTSAPPVDQVRFGRSYQSAIRQTRYPASTSRTAAAGEKLRGRSNSQQVAVLGSVTADALSRCDLSEATVLSNGVMRPVGKGPLDPATLDRLFDAVPESSVVYRPVGAAKPKEGHLLQGEHVLLSIPFFGSQVQMHVSTNGPQGPWQDPVTVATIPPPWNDASKYFCYAPKFHPGVVPVSVAGHSTERREDAVDKEANETCAAGSAGDQDRTLFSWVCNTVKIGTLFEPGRMDTYIPYFFWMDW